MKELLLRVKIKSLTEETKIIRHEDRVAKWHAHAARNRAKQEMAEKHELHNFNLHHHRIVDIREEARASHLAYGFLRGKSYREMEHFSYTQPNWYKIEKMISKYCDQDWRTVGQRFAQWKDEALCGIKEVPNGGVEFYNGSFTIRPQPHSIKVVTPWLIRYYANFVAYNEAVVESRKQVLPKNPKFVEAVI